MEKETKIEEIRPLEGPQVDSEAYIIKSEAESLVYLSSKKVVNYRAILAILTDLKDFVQHVVGKFPKHD